MDVNISKRKANKGLKKRRSEAKKRTESRRRRYIYVSAELSNCSDWLRSCLPCNPSMPMSISMQANASVY